jgi:metal-responsive CopG/Arc/MetJ family transcriptional regulator
MSRVAIGHRRLLHFYIDVQVYNALTKVAGFSGTTRSELIRTACREYLVRSARKARADSNTVEGIQK